MLQTKYQRPDLSNRRDASILLHVARNFISTAEVIRELFFSGLSEDSCRKVLSRLVSRGYLVRYSLINNSHYYRLGKLAVIRWGYPVSRTAKLGAQRLPYEVGALAYTCLDLESHPRKRLMPEELRTHLPWFPDSLMQWAYLWENGRLGTIRVEHRLRAERVVQKLAQQAYRYSQHAEFRNLIEAGDFYFIVITATEHQELALREQAHLERLPVEIRTANYPDLIHFI